MEKRYKRGWIRWMDNFHIFRSALETYGDKPLPIDLRGANGILLKTWAANNRNLYRKGQLSDEQRKLLDSVHIFDVKFRKESRRKKKTAAERKWLTCFDFCKEMLEQYGDEPLPADLRNPDGTLLKHWVTLNRQYYQQGILPEERWQMLSSIGIMEICFT